MLRIPYATDGTELAAAALALLEKSARRDDVEVNPIDRWVMGSVSDKMARHARAVLVARHRQG